jgi:hypothetical protein
MPQPTPKCGTAIPGCAPTGEHGFTVPLVSLLYPVGAGLAPPGVNPITLCKSE